MQRLQLVNRITKLFILHPCLKYFVVVMFFISCAKHTENSPDSDRERWNLKGNVKSLSEIKFSESGKYLTTIFFREDGLVSEQASYNPDKSLIRKWVFSYRRDNLKNMLHCYILEDSLSYVSTYGYDSRGNVISITMDKSDSTLSTRSVILYDDGHNKIKESVYNTNNNLVHETSFKYVHNLLVEENYYDATLNRRWKLVNHYNQQEKKEEAISLSVKDSVLNRMLYSYNDDGKLKETSSFESGNIWVSKIRYAYSDSGDEKERIGILPNGRTGEVQRRDYKYDKSGNWIFMSVTTNDQLQDITTREIQYYE